MQILAIRKSVTICEIFCVKNQYYYKFNGYLRSSIGKLITILYILTGAYFYKCRCNGSTLENAEIWIAARVRRAGESD